MLAFAASLIVKRDNICIRISSGYHFFSPLGIALCAPRDCNSFDTGCFRLTYIHLFTLKPHRVRILQLAFGYMTTEKHDFFFPLIGK